MDRNLKSDHSLGSFSTVPYCGAVSFPIFNGNVFIENVNKFHHPLISFTDFFVAIPRQSILITMQ